MSLTPNKHPLNIVEVVLLTHLSFAKCLGIIASACVFMDGKKTDSTQQRKKQGPMQPQEFLSAVEGPLVVAKWNLSASKSTYLSRETITRQLHDEFLFCQFHKGDRGNFGHAANSNSDTWVSRRLAAETM